jgi:hypothetical protein
MKAVSFPLCTSIHDTDGRVNPDTLFVFQIDKDQKLEIWAQGLRMGGKCDIINDLMEIGDQKTGCSNLFTVNDLEQGERIHGG